MMLARSLPLIVFGLAFQAQAATLVVSSTGDTVAADGACTLREAIVAINSAADVNECTPVSGAYGTADTITFNIPSATDPGCNGGTGVCTITLAALLPAIIQPVDINGYTQPGAQANTLPVQPYPNVLGLNTQIRIEVDGFALGAPSDGLWFTSAAPSSRVRGLSVFNFTHSSIWVLAASTVVDGNFIGMRADGTTPAALVGSYGVGVDGTTGVHIGGVTAASRNLINAHSGVHIVDGSGHAIAGNLIGTDRTGTVAQITGTFGISFVAAAVLPSNNSVAFNLVGNQADAIHIQDSIGTQITGNALGMGVGGVAMGNTNGIMVLGGGVAGTGDVTIQGNGIANSTQDGIVIAGPLGLEPTAVWVDGDNQIFANGGLGINLRPQGEAASQVTANDAMDADGGPNLLQNFPVINSVATNGGGSIDIAFTLSSGAGQSYSIAAFANDACNASGHGEGQYPSGVISAPFTTNAGGTVSGTFTVPAPLPAGWAVGQAVSLLAMNTTTKDTSEFSLCAVVMAGGADTTPNAFAFTDVTGATLSTQYASAAISVSGINAPTAIGVVGGEYRINGGAWVGGAGVVNNGDTIEARVMSAATAATTVSAMLTIGGVSDSFDVTTAAAVGDTTPNAFIFTDVGAATPSTLYQSNPITVAGIDTPSPISISVGEYRVNGGAWVSGPGLVNNGDTVEVRVMSAATAGTTVSATLTIGGIFDSFDVVVPPVGGAVSSVPTLSEWALLLLALTLAAVSFSKLSHKGRP